MDDPRNSVQNLVTTVAVGNQATASIADQIKSKLAANTATTPYTGILYSSAGGTLVNVGAGYLVLLSVTVPSTGTTMTGTLYDAATLANAVSSNAFATIQMQGMQRVDWPFQNGLVVQPSSSGPMAVAVAYTAIGSTT